LYLVFDAAVRHWPRGSQKADASDLDGLLQLSRQLFPDLEMQEDFTLADPRSLVLVPLAGALFRLHPSILARPVSSVDRARFYAEWVDPVLVAREGFGIADLCELVLRRIDTVVNILNPAWHDPPQESPDADARVTEEECRLVQTVPLIDQLSEQCSHPVRVRKALAWATRPIKTVSLDFESVAPFGPTLIMLDAAGQRVPLPAPWWLLVLEESVGILARLATRYQPSLTTDFWRYAGRRVVALIKRLNMKVNGPLWLPDDSRIDFAIVYGRRVVLVNVFSSLTAEQHILAWSDDEQQTLERLGDTLESVVPGTPLRIRNSKPLSTDAAIFVRLLVFVLPFHSAIAAGRGIATMNLEDLDWITRRSTESPDDFFYFCRDLADPPNIHALASATVMDAYEYWRENGKCFHRAGIEIQAVQPQPLQGDLEWYLAAERTPLEHALFTLGLAPIHEWEVVELSENRPVASLAQRRKVIGWEVLYYPVAAAVQTVSKKTPADQRNFSFVIGRGLLWKLAALWESADDMLREALASKHLRLRLAYARDEGPPLEHGGSDGSDVRITWRESFGPFYAEQPADAEELLGRIIAEAFFRGDIRAQFQAAWNRVPRGFGVVADTTGLSCPILDRPLNTSESIRSAARRRTAQILKEQGVLRGIYAEESARNLISQHLYPAFLQQLEETVTQFRAQALTMVLAAENERVHAHTRRKEANLFVTRTLDYVDFDVEDALNEERRRSRRQRMASALALELAVKSNSPGTLLPDDLDLIEVLSLADLCAEYAELSDAIHYGFENVSLTITNAYEVETTGRGSRYDFAAFSRYDAAWTLKHKKVAPAPPETPDEHFVLLQQFPWFTDIDAAVRDEYGFPLEVLFRVLFTLSEYPVTREKPIACVSLPDIQKQLQEAIPSAADGEIAAVLNVLMLTSERLRQEEAPHWEVERRLYRLTTHPVVALSDSDSNEVVILPWVTEGAAKVFSDYLEDGRLPWPRTQLPKRVNDALVAYRRQRNQALEDDIIAVAEKLSLRARKNVKKPASIGLSRLSGEIDALVLDEHRGVMWVVEAKDLEMAYSLPQIAMRLRKFLNPDGYVDKLCKKAEDVAADPAAVAAALGAPHTKQLEVRCLMVTRRPVLAAFSCDVRVPFTTIDDLEEVLARSP
jgi:hypothetical protein